MELSALFSMSYGLYVISSHEDGKDVGCVANTLTQVTASPEQISITLNKDNYTKQVIDKSGVFSASILSKEVSMDVISTFGFKSSKDNDKFAEIKHERDVLGNAYLSKNCVAVISCKVVKKLDIGTHVIFVGELVDAKNVCPEEVMTYAYYHQVKNGATPKNAPSFQSETKKSGFRCKVCGYIYEGDTLPADYICPVCKAPASAFEKL